MKKNIAEEDSLALDDISTFTVSDIHESLLFLEGLFSPCWETKRLTLLRCLIVALALDERVKAILKEFEGFVLDKTNAHLICDNGFSDMQLNNVEVRATAMVRKLFLGLGNANQLRDSIRSMNALKPMVANYMGCKSVRDLETFDYGAFRTKLLKLKLPA
jgi:hypothetical protein